MKKAISILCMLLFLGVSHAQIINVSTGIGNAIGSVDPTWVLAPGSPAGPTTFIVPNFAIGSTVYWQPTPVTGTNAGWINPSPTVSTQTPGNYIFERTIPVPAGTKTLAFNFRIAYDDDLVALEIVRPGGATIPLTGLVVRSTTPTAYYLSNDILREINCPEAGNWKIRAVVNYYDVLGGFLLSGNANIIKGICCDCRRLPASIAINGPTTFSWTPDCTSTLTFSVPLLDPSECYKYSWSICPAVVMSGQNTHEITINCKDLTPGVVYTITAFITCGTRTVTATSQLSVTSGGCCPNPDETPAKAGKGQRRPTVKAAAQEAKGLLLQSVQPNPAGNEAVVNVQAAEAMQGVVTVTDMTGKPVFTNSLRLQSGANKIPLQLQRLAAGSYVVKVSGADGKVSNTLSLVRQ